MTDSETEIKAAHQRTRETYGPERLQADLADHGIRVGIHRIKRLRRAAKAIAGSAPMESCWGSLKNELVHHRRFATRDQAKHAITEYIEIFYNRLRKQARLGYLSPAAFTQQYHANRLAA